MSDLARVAWEYVKALAKRLVHNLPKNGYEEICFAAFNKGLQLFLEGLRGEEHGGRSRLAGEGV